MTFVYQPCGAVEDVVFHRLQTTFYDRDGNESHAIQQVSFEGLITNAAGETFVDRGHATVRFEPGYATGFTIAGVLAAIHAPHEGVLVLDAGRRIYNADFNIVFQSSHALDFVEAEAAQCAGLG